MKDEQASRRAGEQLGREAKAQRRKAGAPEAALPARNRNPSAGSLGEASSPQPGVSTPGGTARRKPKTQNPKPRTQDHDHDCARAWQALRLAHDRVERQLTTELGQRCGLAISDFDVLLYLHLHDGEEVRMHDLSETVLLSQPALSRLVARLVERGLLVRSTASDDGRAIIVCLTDQGREVAARAVRVHTAAVHAVLTSRLTDREQDTLLQTLTRISEHDPLPRNSEHNV